MSCNIINKFISLLTFYFSLHGRELFLISFINLLIYQLFYIIYFIRKINIKDIKNLVNLIKTSFTN